MQHFRFKHLSFILAVLSVVFGGKSTNVFASISDADLNFANTDEMQSLCDGLLKFHPDGETVAARDDASMRALMQRYTLAEFFRTDSNGESMATRHPMIAMNAAQRFLTMIRSAGERTEKDPRDGVTPVRVYAALSDGIPAAGGRRVVGHPNVGEAIVGQLELLADGFKAGLKVPVFVGGPGSGKSETLEVLKNLARNLTLNEDRYYLYSFDFVDLDKIPALANVFGSSPVQPDPLNDSPLLLLPEDFQRAITNQVSGSVAQLSGKDPSPKTRLSPFSQFIREKIIEHYARGQMLSNQQVMAALNKHVRIRRFVLGENGTAPLIDFQGRNVNLGTLFMMPNMYRQAELGTTHPLSHNYGQIVAANGGIVFFDELLKNPEELQNALLSAIQARRYSLDGAPPVEYDVVFFASTNKDDVVKVEEKAKTHKAPILDRLTLIDMNWTIRPHEIAKILMYEVPKLRMEKLGDSSARPESVLKNNNLDKLFPRMESPVAPALGSDGRYYLYVGENPGSAADTAQNRITISPHSLMMIARIASLTRMHIGKAKDQLLRNTFQRFGRGADFIPADFFRDEVARLNLLEGNTEANTAQLQEFWHFSTFTREGTFGLSSRDIAGWLGRAIAEARKPENHNTVTPALLRDVLDDMMLNRAIGQSDEERVLISHYAIQVIGRMLVPGIKHDLNQAIANSNPGELQDLYVQIYEDLKKELRARLNGTLLNSGLTPDQVKRLDQIRAIYQRNTGRPLAMEEILAYADSGVGSVDHARPNTDLMRAVTEYMVEVQFVAYQTKLSRLLNVLQNQAKPNDDDIRMKDQVLSYMREKLGYNEVALAQALQLLSSVPSVQDE